MGYTTDFEGKFYFNKTVDKRLEKFINDFSFTRHMLYNTEQIKQDFEFWRIFTYNGDLGKDGCFIADKEDLLDNKDKYIIDYNRSGDCPSLWAQWIIEDDGLVWDGGEKFYCYDEWLEFYIKNFFKDEGLVLNGVMYCYGEDSSDAGFLIVDENKVYKYNYLDLSYEEIAEKHSSNEEIKNILLMDKKRPVDFEQNYDFSYYGDGER